MSRRALIRAGRRSGGERRSLRRGTIRLLVLGWIALAVGISSSAIEGPQVGRPAPREAFLTPPRLVDGALSLDGTRLAFAARTQNDATIEVAWLDTRTLARRSLFTSRSVRGIDWSTSGDGLVLDVELPATAGARSRRAIGWMPIEGERPRLAWALDPLRQQRVRGVDPSHPHHVLVSETLPDGDRHRLVRVDATTGRVEEIFASSRPIGPFLLDPAGHLGWLQRAEGSHTIVSRVVPGLEGSRVLDVLRCEFERACSLEAAMGDRLFVRQSLDGNLAGLVEIHAPLDPTTQTVAHVEASLRSSDPQELSDLAGVVVDRPFGSPRFAVHHTERRRHHALDPAAAVHLERITARLPDADLAIEARSGVGRWWIEERGDRLERPRHHLYDPRSGTMREILADLRSPQLDPERLVARRHLSYIASDGNEVHGFVSLPRMGDLSSAPIVVQVHGGPWNHARSGYSGLAQFLADRGYVVFEPNFRGSTGYGFRYLASAQGDFGDGRVQQDILDGVDHLATLGWGDGQRVAIIGHSFGGFSVLGALAFTPDRFRVGIASAAPIDLTRSLRRVAEQEVDDGTPSLRAVASELLIDLEDPAAVAALRQRSPEHRVADTARPLLMIAGARDAKVSVVEIRHYALELERRGRDISLLIDPSAGHGFHKPLLRTAHAYLLETLLAQHLDGEPIPPPADPRLRDYLDANLVLRGASLEGPDDGAAR
ncbi:MAG: prolyl oligopeptidase family serine peptidase [Acidobacteriota bacterium]